MERFFKKAKTDDSKTEETVQVSINSFFPTISSALYTPERTKSPLSSTGNYSALFLTLSAENPCCTEQVFSVVKLFDEETTKVSWL